MKRSSCVRKMKFLYSESFISIIIFLDEAFEFGGGSKFWGYVGKALNHFV
jgi:hypothetical protein